MSKLSIVAAVTISLCVPTLVLAASTSKAPLLSGTYIYSGMAHCVLPAESIIQWSGTLMLDPVSGKATLDIHLSNASTQGMIHQISQNLSYSVTARHFTLYSTYWAEYGDVKNGITKYVSLIDYSHTKTSLCVNQGTLVLK